MGGDAGVAALIGDFKGVLEAPVKYVITIRRRFGG
jgi:hypothetical protein